METVTQYHPQVSIIWTTGHPKDPSFELVPDCNSVEVIDQGSQFVIRYATGFALGKQERIFHRSEFKSLIVRYGTETILDI